MSEAKTEAKAAPKAESKKTSKKSSVIKFTPSKPVAPYNLRVDGDTIRPTRDANQNLIWSLTAEQAKAFEKHEFFLTGRVVKVK